MAYQHDTLERPTEPGLYWARRYGGRQYDRIIAIAGTAPFLHETTLSLPVAPVLREAATKDLEAEWEESLEPSAPLRGMRRIVYGPRVDVPVARAVAKPLGRV